MYLLHYVYCFCHGKDVKGCIALPKRERDYNQIFMDFYRFLKRKGFLPKVYDIFIELYSPS